MGALVGLVEFGRVAASFELTTALPRSCDVI